MKNFENYLEKGIVLSNQGNYNAAIEAYDKAIKLKSDLSLITQKLISTREMLYTIRIILLKLLKLTTKLSIFHLIIIKHIITKE